MPAGFAEADFCSFAVNEFSCVVTLVLTEISLPKVQSLIIHEAPTTYSIQPVDSQRPAPRQQLSDAFSGYCREQERE